MAWGGVTEARAVPSAVCGPGLVYSEVSPEMESEHLEMSLAVDMVMAFRLDVA